MRGTSMRRIISLALCLSVFSVAFAQTPNSPQKPQPEIAYAYLDPVLDLYMFSRSDGIVLGGSHEEGVWSTDVNPRRAAQIVDGNGLIAGGMRG